MKQLSRIFASIATGILLAAQPVAASQRLNNMVFELKRVEFPAEESPTSRTVSFEMEREGWIYLGLKGKIAPGAEISLRIDGGEITTLHIDGKTTLPEKMCRVNAGLHRLEITTDDATVLESVVIRAIPQIVFFAIDNEMRTRHKLDYSIIRTYDSLWDQGVLQNFNVLTLDPANHTNQYKEEIGKWRALGRSVITKTSLPKDGREEMEKIETLWVKPMQDPLSDGTIVDEITPKYQSIIPYWGKVIHELGKRPDLKGKKLYTFNSIGFPEIYMPLVEGIVASNYYYGPEVYLRRMGDLTGVTTKMKAWRQAKPGIEKQMIIFLGPDNMAPALSFHVHPEQNYKVFLDRQIRMLANEPAFADLAGVGFWSAHYMDDDILCAFARLARHYLIEGNTEPLFNGPLTLPHIENPGFEAGEKGWKLSRANPESLSIRSSSILQYKKGPYSALPEGKRVLYTKRSKEKPNVVSQTVRHLEPGRIYHLNVYALDLNHFQKAEAIPANVEIRGAEVLEEHTRNSVIRTKARPQDEKPEGEEDPFVYEIVQGKVNVTWNHYHRIFRATGETAEVVISDWDQKSVPSGEEGQELVWDFVDIAPNISLEPVLPSSASKPSTSPR